MSLPKALAFDIFGTVVDWHSSISRETRSFLSEYLPDIPPSDFALQWRELYQPAMRECVGTQRGFVSLDTLHHETLLKLLEAHRVDVSLIDPDILSALAHAWRRLDPWPDVVPGMNQLRQRFPLVTLSNANVELMVALNRYGGLQWDAILGAEFARTYKPDPVAYVSTAQALGLEPRQLCLVAGHHSDLAGARASGLMTAYIDRPMEYGGAPAPDQSYAQRWDWQADSLTDLASQLLN
ncbi:haloacid dehalogenase, type II [Alcanivorax sp. N3-2A]|nr:haloacid dehalogenase, type II [Alcanivorax sp. N3-2A]|tara:strand:- start:21468 stop:22181 length:714 start_codon:yes stop_codon:yes gene_type:complete